MPRKLTHEEFMEKFYVKNKNADNIEILGEYKGALTKIKCKCKIDGYEWENRPANLLSGQGCPKCVGKIKNKTTEEFKQELKDINENIEILGEYINSYTKVKCRCNVDGYEWEATPKNLLNNHGCPKCSGNIKKTHEEFINKLKEINPNIEILGEYIKSNTKIKCKCKIDGHEWETTPNHLLRGNGCPKCGGKMQLTHEEFINRIKI